MVSRCRWLLLWRLDKGIRHPWRSSALGFREQRNPSHLPARPSFLELCPQRGVPGSFPDRAGLMSADAAPKGSWAGQGTCSAPLGCSRTHREEPRAAGGGSGTPLAPTSIHCLLLCPGVQATAGRSRQGSRVPKWQLSHLALVTGCWSRSHQGGWTVSFQDRRPAHLSSAS